jgi:hypothetical protein
MVFEQDSERSRGFFRGLLFKHLTAGAGDSDRIVGLDHERDLITKGFTGRPAFDELVRASEGVPRDAINIVAKAAVHAGEKQISTPNVRKAARQWFQSDKEAALKGVAGGTDLLNWVYDRVIRDKRARGFLVSQRFSSDPLLNALFDARVLHLVRRGYSAQDAPGERYDVYLIDFGAYVDTINTQAAPQELHLMDADAADHPQDVDASGSVDVPVQDLRALRRAILDLEAFYDANPQRAAPSPRPAARPRRAAGCGDAGRPRSPSSRRSILHGLARRISASMCLKTFSSVSFRFSSLAARLRTFAKSSLGKRRASPATPGPVGPSPSPRGRALALCLLTWSPEKLR